MSRYLFIILGVLLGTSSEAQVLFDQSNSCVSNAGNALSVNFFRSTNVESADDFVVPTGQLWRPDRVYAQGSIDLVGRQVRVNIYPDKPVGLCLPGRSCPTRVPEPPALCSFTGTATFAFPAISFNPFNVDLPTNFCELGEGRYWLSLTYADDVCSVSNTCEDWHWDETPGNRESLPWVVRDPARARAEISCTEFGSGQECLTTSVETDLCFSLEGSGEEVPAPTAQRSLVLKTLLADVPFSASVTEFFSQRTGQNLVFSSPDLPPYLTLQTDGTLLGTADIDEVGNDPVFSVQATDSQGRFASLQVALRIVDADQQDLGSRFAPGVVMRCSSAPLSSETITSQVDFSSPGDCANAPASVCAVLPEGASVTNATLSIDLTHPMVSDLKVRLRNPQGTAVTVIDRPGVDDLQPTVSRCLESDIRARFADVEPWTVEQQCEAETALLGALEPFEPLAGFRNQSATGDGDWELTVENAGTEPAHLQRWCLAVQTEPDGLPVDPQTGLPGSATFIDITDLDQVSVSGVLRDDTDVHWYYLKQSSFSREVETRLTSDGNGSVRAYRYPTEKFPGNNPFHGVGDCSQSQILDFPKFRPNFGLEFYRVQGCPGATNTGYELTVVKDVSVLGRLIQPRSSARFRGITRDATTGEPISQAYATDGSSATFSNAQGQYTALVDEGEQEVFIFHPNYLPGSVQAVGVEEQTTDVDDVMLMPVVYQAVINQIIFRDDFE